MIDLDAPRREAKQRDIPVKFRGDKYTLPAELPVDVFAPFLAEDLDLVGALREVMNARDDDDDDSDIVAMLLARPNLPRGLLGAVDKALGMLFDAVDADAGQWARFKSGRPSLNDYTRLVKALTGQYGVGLGEALRSLGLSRSGGATSNPTLPAGTTSTPETSGDTPGTPTS